MLAGFLPLNIYMSAYLSNEPFVAVFASASLAVASTIVLASKASTRSLLLLSVLLALTMLSKYTGVVITVIVISFVVFKLFTVEGLSARRVLAQTALMVVVTAALGAWPYVRNWAHFADPLVWNLDLPGAPSWWQPPSFRTVDYYLGFGGAFGHPYFSLFGSFWDAMYTGLWGEGLPPSVSLLGERHELWNYDLMSCGYVLAAPATLLLGFGIVEAARRALTDANARRRVVLALLTTLVYVFAWSTLQVSMRYPFWGGMRATYALSLVVPIALCAAIGLRTFDRYLAARGWTAARMLFYGWFTAFIGVEALAFGW
jgi:hypothetical protein